MSAAGNYYRERGSDCMQLAEKVPAQKLAHLAAASVCLNLANEFDSQKPAEGARNPNHDRATPRSIAVDEPGGDALAQRRLANFSAMKSRASIVLGLTAIALVVLVCVFYDHPVMKTPDILTSLHTDVAPRPL